MDQSWWDSSFSKSISSLVDGIVEKFSKKWRNDGSIQHFCDQRINDLKLISNVATYESYMKVYFNYRKNWRRAWWYEYWVLRRSINRKSSNVTYTSAICLYAGVFTNFQRSNRRHSFYMYRDILHFILDISKLHSLGCISILFLIVDSELPIIQEKRVVVYTIAMICVK